MADLCRVVLCAKNILINMKKILYDERLSNHYLWCEKFYIYGMTSFCIFCRFTGGNLRVMNGGNSHNLKPKPPNQTPDGVLFAAYCVEEKVL
jgi:hypothetical protein